MTDHEKARFQEMAEKGLLVGSVKAVEGDEVFRS